MTKEFVSDFEVFRSEGLHIVLCTRVLRRSTVARAMARGLYLYGVPFLRIEPLEPSLVIQLLLDSTGVLIFTSAHGVEAVGEARQRMVSGWPESRCFCIEGPCRQKAEAYGFEVLGSAPHSIMLADVVQKSGVTQVVHCTASLHLSTLSDILTKRGCSVKTLEVYHKSIWPVRMTRQFDGYCFFSPSQVDSFLTKNRLTDREPIFALGPTTAKYIKSKGFTSVLEAVDPSEEALLDDMLNFFGL